MLEGAGFEVIDLGINTDVDKYLAALEEHQPDILGMSALLTTTMPYMKVVIDTLTEKGLRDKYIVLCGGAPLNEEFGQAVGADAYCRDAAVAAETAKALVQARRAARRPSRPARRWPDADHVTMPLVIACGALASELRAVLRPAGLADAVEISYLPAHITTGPSGSCPHPRAVARPTTTASARVHRLRRLRHRRRTSTRCSAEHRRSATRLPGDHCYEFFAGAATFAAHARGRARHLLPHRLPRQALRRAVWQGARARSPPPAARHVLRQLPARRAALADRRRSVVDAGRRAAERLGLEFEHRARRSASRSPTRCRSSARRGGSADAAPESRRSEVVIIYWRDIPAQVNGQNGRDRHQVLLRRKFQRAIDRAKRKAGIYTADEDIAQWRRDSEAVRATTCSRPRPRRRRSRASTRREYLGKLAYDGGLEADIERRRHRSRRAAGARRARKRPRTNRMKERA